MLLVVTLSFLLSFIDYLFIYLFIFLNSLHSYSILSSFLPPSRLHFILQPAIPVFPCVPFSIRPSLSLSVHLLLPTLLFSSLLLPLHNVGLPVPLYSFLPSSPLSLAPVLCPFLRSCLLHNSYSQLFTRPHTFFFLSSLSLHSLPLSFRHNLKYNPNHASITHQTLIHM